MCLPQCVAGLAPCSYPTLAGWLCTSFGYRKKTGRNPGKKPKDDRQGKVLLDAVRYFLADTHPLDLDFVMGLPEELQGFFNAWAASRGFDPSTVGASWR
jgi:hypothetical protein